MAPTASSAQSSSARPRTTPRLTGDCYEVCGDYAGFAQEQLQRSHPGVQAMFMLGFAGDSDPYPRGTMELAREHGETLGKEVGRVLATQAAADARPFEDRLRPRGSAAAAAALLRKN